jgi:hypothetical protein
VGELAGSLFEERLEIRADAVNDGIDADAAFLDRRFSRLRILKE